MRKTPIKCSTESNSKKRISWGGIHVRCFDEQEDQNWDASSYSLLSNSDKSKSIESSGNNKSMTNSNSNSNNKNEVAQNESNESLLWEDIDNKLNLNGIYQEFEVDKQKTNQMMANFLLSNKENVRDNIQYNMIQSNLFISPKLTERYQQHHSIDRKIFDHLFLDQQQNFSILNQQNPFTSQQQQRILANTCNDKSLCIENHQQYLKKEKEKANTIVSELLNNQKNDISEYQMKDTEQVYQQNKQAGNIVQESLEIHQQFKSSLLGSELFESSDNTKNQQLQNEEGKTSNIQSNQYQCESLIDDSLFKEFQLIQTNNKSNTKRESFKKIELNKIKADQIFNSIQCDFKEEEQQFVKNQLAGMAKMGTPLSESISKNLIQQIQQELTLSQDQTKVCPPENQFNFPYQKNGIYSDNGYGNNQIFDDTKKDNGNSMNQLNSLLDGVKSEYIQKIQNYQKQLEELKDKQIELSNFNIVQQIEVENQNNLLLKCEQELKEIQIKKWEQQLSESNNKISNSLNDDNNNNSTPLMMVSDVIAHYFGFEFISKIQDEDISNQIKFQFIIKKQMLLTMFLTQSEDPTINNDSNKLLCIISEITISPIQQQYQSLNNSTSTINITVDSISAQLQQEVNEIIQQIIDIGDMQKIIQTICCLVNDLIELNRHIHEIQSQYCIFNYQFNTQCIQFTASLEYHPTKEIIFKLSPQSWYNDISIEINNNNKNQIDDKENKDIDKQINTQFNSIINSQPSYHKLLAIINTINRKHSIISSKL